MRSLRRFGVVPILILASRGGFAGTLWLGNDTAGLVYHMATDGTVLGSIPTPVTGIAFDGTTLYFSNSGGGTTERTPDGNTILDTFSATPSGSPTEDLAWDSTRDRLWRIDHFSPTLVRIDPVTNTVDQTFALPTSDPLLQTLGGLGIAYDPTRDLLYASFCQVGCSSFGSGLIMSFDPDTGLPPVGGLVLRPGFATGGLGYDPLTDTLWVGANQVIHNIRFDGTDLSSFTKPGGSGFTDGLEFIPSTPEPATCGLLAGALLFLSISERKRRRRA